MSRPAVGTYFNVPITFFAAKSYNTHCANLERSDERNIFLGEPMEIIDY